MTQGSHAPVRATAPPAGRADGARRRTSHSPYPSRVGLLFVTPFLLFLLLFQYVPIAMLVRNSFYDYTLIRLDEQTFVGLAQYERMFIDPSVGTSFLVTLLFAAGVVAFVVPFGFLLAVFLNGRFAGRSLVRTIVFLPVVTSVAVTSTMWLFMLTRNGGLVNSAITSLGFPPVAFLTSVPLALISIIVMTVWQQVGFAAVLFLTGLQSVPTDVVEAASLDGAGRFRTLTAIVLPLMSRTMLFVVIAMTVFSLQAFAPAFLMTSGGPANSTSLLVYTIYNAAFRLQDPGFASALAVAVMAIALVLSGVQSIFLRTRWSY